MNNHQNYDALNFKKLLKVRKIRPLIFLRGKGQADSDSFLTLVGL